MLVAQHYFKIAQLWPATVIKSGVPHYNDACFIKGLQVETNGFMNAGESCVNDLQIHYKPSITINNPEGSPSGLPGCKNFFLFFIFFRHTCLSCFNTSGKAPLMDRDLLVEVCRAPGHPFINSLMTFPNSDLMTYQKMRKPISLN